MTLTLNTHTQLVLRDRACTSASLQLFNLSLSLSHASTACAPSHTLSSTDETNYTIFDSELSLSVVYANPVDGPRSISVSSSVEKVDILAISEKNHNNAIVVNCNAIEPFVQALNQFVLVLNSLSFIKKEGKADETPSSRLVVNVDFPAVILKYVVFGSVYVFANAQNVLVELVRADGTVRLVRRVKNRTGFRRS